MTTQSGLLLIDKPEGWTSHDVVAKSRSIAGTRRVGHAGTLDPMATGLLVLGINSATKLLTFIVGESKTYIATIRLGASTITDDRESEYTAVATGEMVKRVNLDLIREAMASLTGEIMQVPSSVSAIKVNGERAYALVRGGEEVKLAPRAVTVSRFEMLGDPRLVAEAGNDFIDIDVIVDCSSGTYIRALARDLGEKVGVGGHLTALRRTRVGGYDISMATPMADLKKDDLPLLSSANAARAQFSVRELIESEVNDLRHGKRIGLGHIEPTHTKATEIAAFAPNGELVAMLTRSGKQLKSIVVFAQEQNG